MLLNLKQLILFFFFQRKEKKAKKKKTKEKRNNDFIKWKFVEWSMIFFPTFRIKCRTKQAQAEQWIVFRNQLFRYVAYTTVGQTVLRRKFSISKFIWEN